jgi:hypothetical protein
VQCRVTFEKRIESLALAGADCRAALVLLDIPVEKRADAYPLVNSSTTEARLMLSESKSVIQITVQ